MQSVHRWLNGERYRRYVTIACTVVVADDHRLYRLGLVHALRERGFEVLAEADSGPTAVTAVLRASPDVVLMDLEMPGFGGAEATRRIHARDPGVQILALTVDASLSVILEALAAGMTGYLLKDTPIQGIADGLIAAAKGDAPMSPRVARGLVAHVRRTHGVPAVDPPQLTDRELDVLALMCDGCSNQEIATQLMISPHTVKSHIGRVLEKLECANRVQAVVRAQREGLLRGDA